MQVDKYMARMRCYTFNLQRTTGLYCDRIRGECLLARRTENLVGPYGREYIGCTRWFAPCGRAETPRSLNTFFNWRAEEEWSTRGQPLAVIYEDFIRDVLLEKALKTRLKRCKPCV